MKARDALIAWTPIDSALPSRGQVEVRAFDPEDTSPSWMETYAFALPAGTAHRSLRGDASIRALFVDFQYLIVEEHLDSEAVHRAFLVIDEYAKMFGVAGEPVSRRR